MDDNINSIIKTLYESKITYEEAINYVNNYKYEKEKNNSNVKAKKIKIRVHDKKSGRKINLPKLSFNFIKRISTFGIRVAKKYSDDIPTDFSIDDLNQLVNTLMNEPPFTIIEVKSEEADVLIYTC